MGSNRADARTRAALARAARVGAVAVVVALATACAPAEEPSSTGAAAGRPVGDGGTDGRTAVADGRASTSTPVHPAFELDRPALAELVADSPAEVRGAVDADPRGFLELVDAVLDQPANRTVLVDKTTRLPESYVPVDLVELDTLSSELALSRAGHRLTRDTVDALLEMSAAAAGDGITLVVSSAYRSYAYQADLFERWVDELGLEEAERVSARPGTSQHQIGTTVDFGCICGEFASQPAGIWLAEHAWRYGFSLSYPDGYEDVTGYSYEPWHFRYIGRDAARLERDYFEGIQQWMLEFLHARRAELEAARHDDR